MQTKNIMDPSKLPFFSVVIPVYNKEPHIARSIESVLKQSFSNFELLIICDPSTDNSNIEVQKFFDSRIRIFYRDEPGPGGYAARNLGIQKAKSDWIAFLDADDEWYIDYLKTVHHAIIKSHKPSFVGSGWHTLDPQVEHQPVVNSYFINNIDKGIHTLDFKQYLLSDINVNRPFYTSTAVIKKSLLIKSGLFPAGKANRGGDVDTWLRCIFLSKGLTVNNYVGACYYRDSVNMVTKNSIDDASTIRETINIIINQVSDKEITSLLKELSNYYTKTAWLSNYNATNYEKNFKLYKAIYYDINTINSLAYGVASLLPEKMLLKIWDNKDKIKNSYLFKPLIGLIK